MGFWSTRLYGNDTTADVRDSYTDYLTELMTNDEAYKKTCEDYAELMGTDEEALFWYALADTQWKYGRLMPEVKKRALEMIEKKESVSLFEEEPKCIPKWLNTLQKLKEKLESPMPPEKKFRKPREFVTNPGEIGDVYVYQFHTKKAEECGMLGKYIAFQKTKDVEWYGGPLSQVRFFDMVFDEIPTLDEIKGLRPLLMVYSEGEFKVPVSYFLESKMDHYKAHQYPVKYLTLIGNMDLTDNPIDRTSSLAWQQDMDDFIIDFYLDWHGKEYPVGPSW